jgi:hypothetical protein
MKLSDVIKTDKGFNKEDILGVITQYNYFHDLQSDFKKLKIDKENIKDIIDIFLGEKNQKTLGFISILYSEIRDFTSASEFAFACFCGNKNGISFELYCNTIIDLFNDNLIRDDYNTAKKELKKLENFVGENKNFDGFATFNNIVVGLETRLEDNRIFHNKVKKAEENMEKQQWKFIEIIGLFSAVIAFIITNIQIASINNLSEISIIRLMFGMACVLLIFSIAISYLFSVKRNKGFWSFFNDGKFLALVVLVLLLLIIINTI